MVRGKRARRATAHFRRELQLSWKQGGHQTRILWNGQDRADFCPFCEFGMEKRATLGPKWFLSPGLVRCTLADGDQKGDDKRRGANINDRFCLITFE